MEKYNVLDVDVSPDKVTETKEILNYVKEEQDKSEKVRDLFLKKPIIVQKKKLVFKKSIYTFAYVMQWILLLFPPAAAILHDKLLLLPFLVLFLFFEILILEQGRRINPDKIRYRKRFPFTVLDLLVVVMYFSFLGQAIGLYFSDHVNINYTILSIWAVYTLLRKIYIYKNLTYEK